MRRGKYALLDRIKALEAEMALLRKPSQSARSKAGTSSAGQIDGTLVATLKGHAAVGSTSAPITWTKVTSEGDDVAFDESLIKCDRDGAYTFGLEVAGKWPAGFHRFDYVDGAAVCVLPGGNMNADPMVHRVPVNRGQIGHAVINGYGNTIALGVTSHTSHHEPVGGQPYAVPTRIDITCFVTRQMEG